MQAKYNAGNAKIMPKIIMLQLRFILSFKSIKFKFESTSGIGNKKDVIPDIIKPVITASFVWLNNR